MKELYRDKDYRASTAWCFSRGERLIDEYIIESDDYIGIGAGSVSVVDGNFLVNTFSLDKYDQLIKEGRLPIAGWRKLSGKEHRRYYLLTKLFGMKVDTAEYRRRFNESLNRRLWLETGFFRGSGVIRGKDILQVTERGMYTVSVMMRDFFASLNTLREKYIERQV